MNNADIHGMIMDIHKMCVDKNLTYGEFYILVRELKRFSKDMRKAQRAKYEKKSLHMPCENSERMEEAVREINQKITSTKK